MASSLTRFVHGPLIAVLLAVALALPATDLAWFDGLPITAGLEALAFAILLPVLCGGERRARWLSLFGRLLPALLLLLVAVVGAKAALAARGETAGWRGCYTWRMTPPPRGACEVSYDNPLQRFGATRLDRAIDFGRHRSGAGRLITPPAHVYHAIGGGIATTNWNFSFLNSTRFNFYGDQDHGTTERLPFAVTWTGTIAAPAPEVVRVDYVGEGLLRIGDREHTLPPAYDEPGRVDLPALAGRQSFELHYVYDDGRREGRGAPALGRLPELRVTHTAAAIAGMSKTASSAFVPLRTAPASFTSRALAGLIDVSLLLLTGSVLVSYARHRWFRLFAAAVLALGLLAWQAPAAFRALPTELFGLASCAVMLALILKPGWRSSAAAFGLVTLVQALRTWHDLPALSAVIYRAPGMDWLTYESFARTILETGSLEGGEAVFYYQAGWRYLLFGLRLIWGDNDGLLATSHAVLLTWGMCFAFIRFAGLRAFGRDAASIAMGGAALLLVALANHDWVINTMRVGASETGTWLMIAPMAALLFAPRERASGAQARRMSTSADLVGGCLLAILSISARLTQLPATIWALAASAARQHCRSRDERRVAPASVLLVAAPPAIALGALLLHNYVYGGAFNVLPTSVSLDENNNLPLLAMVAQPVAQTLPVLIYQLRMIMFLPPNYHGSAALLVIGWLLWAVWGWTMCAPALRRARTPWAWAMLAWPLAYLLPYVSLSAPNFYPRHVLAGYFALGLAVMAGIGLAEVARASEREPGGADQDGGR